PVSGFPRQLRLRRRLDSALTLAALHRTLTPLAENGIDEPVKKLDDLEAAIELRGPNFPAGTTDELSDSLAEQEAALAHRLADRLQVRSAENQPGAMVFNPCSFA